VLAEKTYPDITYVMHKAARLSHNPKNNHALPIKRTLRYLKKSQYKGMLIGMLIGMLMCLDGTFVLLN